MITLYDYWRSSASYRVRIALNLAGEDWQAVSVNLLDAEHRSDAHLARNPQGLVPAIDIDGQVMTQSLAIIEYLDKTRGLGLIPSDPLEKARVQALAHAIAMEIHPVCNLSVAKYASSLSDDVTMQSWMHRYIPPGLAALEAMVTGSNFCHGDAMSLADLCLVPQIYNANRWDIDLSDMPKLSRIAAQLDGIPAVAQAHPTLFEPK